MSVRVNNENNWLCDLGIRFPKDLLKEEYFPEFGTNDGDVAMDENFVASPT